jgi:tetratricopeptide (TPR) repeat protein
VHRDIKPSNIMVDKSGCCKLVDFGLAKVIGDSELTLPGTVMGSANYMSPEQGQGLNVDQRGDLFSLGTVLYEMLSGQRPFERDSLPATIHAIVHDTHPELPAGISEQFADCRHVIDRVLAKSPVDRYQSADAFEKELRNLLGGLPVKAMGKVAPVVLGLAVLYLRNLGAEEDEFLSYGITEDLIVDLTRIGSLRVAPMRSILKFKESKLELVEIATQLDVSLVLDGSICKSADSIRASAQLVDVRNDEILWADRWEEPLERLPNIKESLAAGIGNAIDVDTNLVAAAQVGRPETSDPQAYEFYLRGKYTFEHRQSATDAEVAVQLYRRALEVEPSMPAARTGLAEIMLYAGQPDYAATRLLNVLAEARRLNRRADEANALRMLARSRSQQSRWGEAVDYATQAVKISVELGDLAGEANALGILIEIMRRRAEFAKALDYAQRVLEINRRLLDQEREAEALNNIGAVYLFSGDTKKALEFYQEALTIAKKRNDLSLQGRCIANLGSTLVYRNEFEQAREHYERALELFRRLGDLSRQATILNNMARIHISTGSYGQALDYYGKALEIHQDIGDRGGEGLAHNNRAIIHTLLGRYEEAESALGAALTIAEELAYPLIQTAALSNLGFLHFCRDDFEQAAGTLEQAREVAESAGLQRELAAAHDHLGDLRFREGRFDEAFRHFEETEAIAERLGLRQVRLKARAHLAVRKALAGELEPALAELEGFRQEAAGYPDPAYVLAISRLLGKLLIEQGTTPQRQNGIALLKEMRDFAQKHEVSYEVKWISELLHDLKID